ncbi:hypothetical protein D3C84_1004720 [compost metagenome]
MLELLAGHAPVGVEVQQHRLAAGSLELGLEVIQGLDADKPGGLGPGAGLDARFGQQQILAHHHQAHHRQQQHEAAETLAHRVGAMLVVVIEITAQHQPPAEPEQGGDLVAQEP